MTTYIENGDAVWTWEKEDLLADLWGSKSCLYATDSPLYRDKMAKDASIEYIAAALGMTGNSL